jgi:hypothetical protein
MAGLINVGKSLLVRYNTGSFTYSRIKTVSSDEKIYDLAQAINSVQVDNPTKIISVTRRKLA